MTKLSNTQINVTYNGRVPEGVFVDAQGMVQFRLSPKRFDVASWKNHPVHVALANVPAIEWQTQQPTFMPIPARVEPENLVHFVKRYGTLTNFGPIHGGSHPAEYHENPETFARMQAMLRGAWRGGEKWLDAIAGGENKLPIQQHVVIVEHNIEFVADDLWSYIRLIFFQDRSQGLLGICENENCTTPYFRRGRKDQVHCSRECAMAAASRNYRSRVKSLIAKEKKAGRWPKRGKA